MTDESNDQTQGRTGVTREQLLTALEASPVFEFASLTLGPIQVTDIRVNTLERIALEFERTGATVDSKLRRLLREIGQITDEHGKTKSISEAHASNVTPDELAEFARRLLISEGWLDEETAVDEPDPKARLVRELHESMNAVGAAHRKILDRLGSAISTASRTSIANSTRLAEKLRMDVFADSPALKAIQDLQKKSPIAKISRSIAEESPIQQQVRRMAEAIPSSSRPAEPPTVTPFPPLTNPAIESARATALSTANLEKAMERLEKRANDAALLIAGIHDMIRDTTLDMAQNAKESSAATKQSLDQAAASVALGAQSLAWAKYALITSVAIGFVSLIFAAVSAWYAVHPASSPTPVDHAYAPTVPPSSLGTPAPPAKKGIGTNTSSGIQNGGASRS